MKKLFSLFAATVMVIALTAPGAAAREDDCRQVAALMNERRQQEGGRALQWSADLEAAAKQRASEIAVHYTSDHTRPDGSKFYTVSNLVWGENTAYGYQDVGELVDAWLRSAGHKKNILREDYTITAVACVRTSDSIYWVQVFGTGADNSPWTGNSPQSKAQAKTPSTVEAAARKTDDAGSRTVLALDTVSSGRLDGEALNRKLTSALSSSGADPLALRISGAGYIGSDTLQQLERTADSFGATVQIIADTNASGSQVQGRLYIEPANLSKAGGINLGVYTDPAKVADTKARMEKHYRQPMAFVRLSQEGDLGAVCRVAAKVDLSGMDMNQLRIYAYNRQANSLRLLESAEPHLDENGFLQFYTKTGGDLILTDRAF